MYCRSCTDRDPIENRCCCSILILASACVAIVGAVVVYVACVVVCVAFTASEGFS